MTFSPGGLKHSTVLQWRILARFVRLPLQRLGYDVTAADRYASWVLRSTRTHSYPATSQQRSITSAWRPAPRTTTRLVAPKAQAPKSL